MSAITGICDVHCDPTIVEHGMSLMQALQKYPADDIQVWHKGNIFLGCHAQWITPESIGEQLPLYDAERQLAITADAIIDNREELFEKLQVDIAYRKVIKDSELILLAYYKWDEEAPKHLIGDFAFMIWDERKNKIFGARDFSGSRTLYFYRDPLRFAFCSTIEPLLTLPYVENKLNDQWLAQFLAIIVTTDTVDSSSTVYKNIEQIPPSHSVSVMNGKVTFSRYSTIIGGEMLQLKSNMEYEEAFRNVFQSAVKSRIRTHRKVGAQLSGGLDSGSVVSFAARELRSESKRLHTFSYVPVNDFVDWTRKSKFANERPFIQSTVKHVGNITDNYLDFPGKSPLTEVDDWLELMEMPYKFFENSFWLKGIYEAAQQQGIGVMLNGQRGNWTISWGPALDYQAALLRKLKLIQFYREIEMYSKNIGVGKSRVLKFVGKKAFPFMKKVFPAQNQPPFPTLINLQFAQKMNVFEKLKEHGFDSKTDYSFESAYETRKRQFEELNIWGLNGTIGTRISLRYSLWDRDPTNDLRVIRFCLSVPEKEYVKDGYDRALIRRATESYLPNSVRLNQRTRGVQGADGVHRMAKSWHVFMDEVRLLITDPVVSHYLNIDELRAALYKIQNEPKPEYVYGFEFRILMRGLIFGRFIKKFA